MVVDASYLEEFPRCTLASEGIIAVLVDHYRRVECEFRDLVPHVATSLDDPVTAKLLTRTLLILERDLGTLERHLDPDSRPEKLEHLPSLPMDFTVEPPFYGRPQLSSFTH